MNEVCLHVALIRKLTTSAAFFPIALTARGLNRMKPKRRISASLDGTKP